MQKRNEKILVVDDQPGMRMLIQQVLAEAGYQAETAADGRSGLERANQERPRLILVDMKMPGMTGLEFVAQLKDTGWFPRVVLMSGYHDLSLMEQAEKMGVDHWLTKPFNIDELLGLVAKLIPGAEAE